MYLCIHVHDMHKSNPHSLHGHSCFYCYCTVQLKGATVQHTMHDVEYVPLNPTMQQLHFSLLNLSCFLQVFSSMTTWHV